MGFSIAFRLLPSPWSVSWAKRDVLEQGRRKMTEDDLRHLWKLTEFVKQSGGQMFETGNPRAVRFVLPDAAVDDVEEVLEANDYVVISTSEPRIFQREYVVASARSLERPAGPLLPADHAARTPRQGDRNADETQRLLDELEELLMRGPSK